MEEKNRLIHVFLGYISYLCFCCTAQITIKSIIILLYIYFAHIKNKNKISLLKSKSSAAFFVQKQVKNCLSAKCLLFWSHKNVSYLWSEFLCLYTPCSLVSVMVHVRYQVAGTYKSCCRRGILYLHPPSTIVFAHDFSFQILFVYLGGWGLFFAFVFC